ncbi:GntR family transcriptional regulator [Clostridium swellfunianum]|uniref:GntR family transcriptional regulator n=1 Tax=Clostridium swellfunianum TaxID=1367462 RepID=UPI00202F1F53|nr:GntR family transcriptional regulator [Clostridium swellfunianum]MCM0649432.1 GntR family transcriptional regulator [Clostridium swellfunianum]
MGGIVIEILLNKDSGVPLYLQVKKQIMDLIRNGSLKIGSKMPTERELSERLKVSRNTISTAYKELEQEGVLKSYQGRGTFVAEEAKPWKAYGIKDKIIKFVDLGLEEALETGIDPDEFLEIVALRINEKKEQMSKMTAVYIECNVEQARMFSQQLSKSTNMNIIPLTLPDLHKMEQSTKDLIEKSQVIIATFNHVNEVKELTGSFKREVLGIAINPDLGTIVKIARFPDGVKFGFICISEEFKFKIRGALEEAGLGNINIVYSNTHDEEELKEIINNSDVLIVSPGRYNDVKELNKDNKEIIRFLYSLDDGSVKALKPKILEINYLK